MTTDGRMKDGKVFRILRKASEEKKLFSPDLFKNGCGHGKCEKIEK